ncbi:unnamed protein product [Gongylonema pulchrum]|uniref:Pre-mRNA-splicing factor CWC25 homolog n=1 Tax=Gongylonema pulchrum TaxID=637853 RepID=A0A183E8T4_9BILA|nr:unnamed protein product [Gongylonema pulchrum]
MADGDRAAPMNDAQLRWIYEGTKSLVNREDYLLGKKVDRNFELYSDVVVKEKEGGFEAVQKPRISVSSGDGAGVSSKISNLQLDVVRTEDPLVAIKMKEEQIRQEKMENPLVKLKMQRLLRKAMEKKEKKRLKKLKMKEKKKRKHRHKSGGDSDREDVKEPKAANALQRDTHIPAHLRPRSSASGSEDEQCSSRSGSEKHGLSKTTKRGESEKEHFGNPYELIKKRPATSYKKPEKRQLTEKEMEAKRREMMENADWRDKVRVHNIGKNARRDEEEDKRNEGKIANFIRPLLNSAASRMSMEQQLKSHRKGLQRTCGFTEQKFAKR